MGDIMVYKKLSRVICFLLLVGNITVFSEDYYGSIIQNDEPVVEATVILIELDIIELSDKEGKFAFFDVDPGEYTLKVITLAADEVDFSFSVNAGQDNSTNPTVFEIVVEQSSQAELVEEEIIVTADRDIQQEPNITEYGEAEVENTSLARGDPFSIITSEAGVVQDDIGNSFLSRVIAPSTNSFFTLGTSYSVFGGDSAWNQNYVDFLPVPTNAHYSNSNQPIITKETVGSIKTIKGPPPGRYGQSLGGTVIAYPKDVQNNRLLLGLSVTAPYIGYKQKIGKHATLFAIARQSIERYTILPIIAVLAYDDSDINIDLYAYGDYFLSFTYKNQNDVIKVLGLSHYDIIQWNVALNLQNDPFEGEKQDFPYFFGGGMQWRKVVADRGLHVIDIISYYSVVSLNSQYTLKKLSDDAIKRLKERGETKGTIGYDYDGTSKVWYSALNDSFSWALTDKHIVSTGSSVEYSVLDASYGDTYTYANISNPTDQKKDVLPKYTINEDYLRLYLYGQYDYEDYFDRGDVKFSISPGVSWIAQSASSLYPSLRSEYATTFSDIHTISFSLGWSPAFLEKLQYIDRKVLEKTVEYTDSKTSYTDPNYGIMASTKYLIELGNHQLSLTPYFGWYYNFHGIFSQFRYRDTDATRSYAYKPVNYGYGTGATTRWKYSKNIQSFELSYTLGFSYFYTKDNEWLPSNDDTRHTIGMKYSVSPHEVFTFALSSSFAIDKPFTPNEVVKDDKGNLIRQEREINSAREYIPVMTLVPSFTGVFVDNKVLTFNYRFALGNLLAFLTFKRDIKDDKIEGASDKDIDGREYTYDIDANSFTKYLEFSLYLTFKL